MFGWKSFTGHVTGVLVPGDTEVKPTRWWNRLFLALWGWKTIAVFQVEDSHTAYDGYRIGFIPFRGQTQLEQRVSTTRIFKVKIGHEDCTFFAVDRSGKEIAIRLIARTPRDDPRYTFIPMH